MSIIKTRCTRGVRVVFSEQECDLEYGLVVAVTAAAAVAVAVVVAEAVAVVVVVHVSGNLS